MSMPFTVPSASGAEGNLDTAGTTELEIASTVFRLASVARGRLSDALRRHGLSWARYEVLDVVCRQGPVSYSEVSRALCRHRTSITSTAAVLESRNLIARFANPCNPQQWMLEGTELGRRTVERASRALTSTCHQSSSQPDYATVHTALLALEDYWSRP